MHVGMETIWLSCPKGLTSQLCLEVKELGLNVLEEHKAAVETRGSLADCMQLNLCLRTAHRVLFKLAEGPCRNPDELYDLAREIPWEDHFGIDDYVCITSLVRNDTIRDTRFANLKCKDALVDRFWAKYAARPDTGPMRDRAVVFFFWQDDRASFYLDTSGESLCHRGYRKQPGEAPMRETLAAACVLETAWTGEGNFINPMCGSGTLAIEAALIAKGIAPGSLRESFGFQFLKGFDEAKWTELCTRTQGRDFSGRILASDIDPHVIETARANAAAAGVEEFIEFSVQDFREHEVPEGGGVFFFNPPYGERMGDVAELEGLYKDIGDFLKQRATGYTGWIFTGNIRMLKRVGLRPGEKRVRYNGAIECRLADYEMY
jgi:23S rRNA G2445 N2-methylase RlmL